MYQREKTIWMKHWDFMLLDVLCLQAAYVLAFIIRHGIKMPYSIAEYRNLGFIMILVEICLAFFMENYKDIIHRGYFEEFKKTFILVSIVSLVLFAYLFVTKTSKIYSRMVLGTMWGIGICLTWIARLLWKKVVRKQMVNKARLQRMVLISTKERVRETLKVIQSKKYKDFYVSGILLSGKDISEKEIDEIPVIGSPEEANQILKSMVVDEVFLDLPAELDITEKIRRECDEMGITSHLNLGQVSKTEGHVIVENYAEHMVLTSSIKFAEPRQIFLKRVMDIAGGLVGIVITLILTVILGPIIYIQSPGPIFFSQERVGRNGRKFKIYKFRSMYPDAEERKKELMKQNKMQGLMFKMDNDPRIIPIGRFIRKTSLDEFPQFFNVLKGDMSLVGTRPPTVDEYEQYEMHHKARLAAKPGLTGMWQVSGRSDIVDFEEVVRLDKKYISEWNIGLDLRILLKTIQIVFTGKGSV